MGKKSRSKTRSNQTLLGVSPASPSSNLPNPEDAATISSLFNTNRFEDAARYATALTKRRPKQAFGWTALGYALDQMGNSAKAVLPLETALSLQPNSPDILNLLGVVLRKLGQFSQAENHFKKLLTLQPGNAMSYYQLGSVLADSGNKKEAALNFRKALEIFTDFADAHSDLAIVLHDLGHLDKSMEHFNQALKLRTTDPETYYNLGNLQRELGQFEMAINSYKRALELSPTFVFALVNLGTALRNTGRFEEAAECHQKAIGLNYNVAEAHSNLGIVFRDLGKLDSAVCCYQKALELNPNFAGAHNNMGNTFQNLGRIEEAISHYKQALQIQPNYTEAHCSLLFAHNYLCDQPRTEMLELAKGYGRLVSSKVSEPFVQWLCPAQPQRLRVGIVSGDLHHHPVGYFLESVLAQLDPSRVELYAFPTYSKTDPLTLRIKKHFASWTALIGDSDEYAARTVHASAIHVLLDLSGHTSFNRLPVFAWKPAPIQVSWLGYFATTGVAEMDYILADPHSAPPEEDHHFTEQLWRLPDTRLCFTPPDVDIDASPLPALANGYITFGCFNNLSKMNDAVVLLWSRILLALPTSRLFLKCAQLNDATVQETTRARFNEHGIERDRLILECSSPRPDYLAAYHRVDLALDPFPYPGGTTTVEGLWMGVPVVTKKGDRFLSHQGESLLHNAGLSDWIASDEIDYFDKSVALASDWENLASLRARLRQQVL